MKRLLRWLGLIKAETKYVTRWLPKPSDIDLARVLMSTEFERFVEMVKEEMSLMIQAQSTMEARNEKVLEFRGILTVENRAKELVALHTKKQKEEKISLETTDEDQLAREFEEAQNGQSD